MAADIYNHIGEKFKTKEATIQKWWFPIQYNYCNVDGDLSYMGDRAVTMYEKYDFSPWKKFEVESCESITSIGNKTTAKKYMRLKQNGNGKTLAETPAWWTAYNDVKHQRTTVIKGSTRTNFSKANLWNLSNAFSALYIMELSYIWAIGEEPLATGIDQSVLFEGKVKPATWKET